MSERSNEMIDLFQAAYKDDIHRIDGYNIFADESMNLRKVRIQTSTKNELKYKFFVLGGIEVPTTCDLEDLKKEFVDDNFPDKEVKYKYFSYSNSDFKIVLKSKRLNKLFKFMIKNKIYIHVSVLNYWYWAIADIYDSIIVGDRYDYAGSINIKSALYEALIADYDSTFNIFLKFNFPSIPHGLEKNFLIEINNILKNVVNTNKIYNDYQKRCINELIVTIDKKTVDITELTFIQDETPREILNSLSNIYIYKIAHFIYNGIIFDRELNIEKDINLKDERLLKLGYCKFEDSTNSFAIQISDVIVGFVARLYEFISKDHEAELYYKTLKANSIEIDNIRLFKTILYGSERKYRFNNIGIMSVYQKYRLNNFFETAEIIYY